MTKQVQRRRGTDTQHTSFTGAEGELSVNTSNKSIHVHDGSTAGGIETARADLGNVSDADLNSALTGNTLSSLTITSADINGGTIDGTVIGGTTPAAGNFTTGSFTGNATFGDNDKAIFGAGSDLQIYHSGSNSHITESGTGNLIIRADDFRVQSNAGEEYIAADANGAVSLRYDNATKLATTSTGIDVTGTVTADGLTVDGGSEFNGLFEINNSSVRVDLMETDAPDLNGRIQNTGGTLRLNTLVDDKTSQKIRLSVDHSTGDISFYEDTGTTPKFFWDASTERLGIGNAAPATTLDVTGTVTADGLTVGDGTGAESIRLDKGASSAATIEFYSGGAANGKIEYNAFEWLVTNSVGQTVFQTAAKDRLNISANGDISFYEDTGTTPKFFWDASAERLGIGTSSPIYALQVGDYATTSQASFALASTTTGTCNIRFGDGTSGTTASRGRIEYDHSDDSLAFWTVSEERMRLDASGNLLVGKTSTAFGTAGTVIKPTTGVTITRSAADPLALNRLSTDGEIIGLYKDGVTVGSIGSHVGGLLIGTPQGNDSYVKLEDNGVRPATSTGGYRDGAINLGHADSRFKDLYLSGGVYLGGTGAANKLDDYEEGNWTPVITLTSTAPSVTYTNITGAYTKVGNLIFASFDITVSSVSGGSGSAILSGLPFFVSNSGTLAGYSAAQWRNSSLIPGSVSGAQIKGFAQRGAAYIYLQYDNSGSAGFGTNSNVPNWSSSGRATGYIMYTTN